MKVATSLLLALSGATYESSVVLALQRPRSGVYVVRRCVDVADLLATAATGQAQAALLAADLPRLTADVVAALRTSGVEPIGIVSTDSDVERHRLHQIGIGIVVTAAAADHIAAVVADAVARGAAPAVATVETVSGSQPATPPPPHEALSGRVIAVWGPNGAPGRSTVALNLAAELAKRGRPTLLVDADVYGGAVAQLLAILDEASGVLAAARSANIGSLDARTLAAHCRQVGPMLRILTGLPRADRWPELSPTTMRGVLAVARALAAHVVVDCGFCLELDEELSFDTAAPRRNGATLATLEAADVVLVVGAADPLGLARLARGVLDVAAAVPGARLEVVVNRMRPRLGWSETEVVDTVQRFTGIRPRTVLPEDRDACDDALVRGRTLLQSAPRSRLRAGIRELAGDLDGHEEAARQTRGGRRKRRVAQPESSRDSPPTV